ncbi:DivIVA domain-containing protein [Arthrobacter sp. B0490]|uniref:DivIVA domain-containing protein n=1 Tax=Arthrobacter sp. B0490 TaxID=2058891 RepID=UPI0021581F93|nr:DivIVA domain-containing protein [Arthrobacter sp. B0490]
MTIFLVILAVLLVGGTAVLASGRPLPSPLQRLAVGTRAGSGPGAPGGVGPSAGPSADAKDAGARMPRGLVEPVASLPPVLLPAAPSAQDVDAIRFGLGLRGYRMDQVDEVLDRLAAALEDRDAVIAGLRSQLAGRAAGRDAGPDAGRVAGRDAGPDAGRVAGQDAGPDAGRVAGRDAGR